MASKKLRIDQYPTVLYNANLNPLGIPESVKKAISENIDSITKYPDSRRRILAMLLFERIGLNISGKASACFLTARPQNKVFQDISLSPRP